MRKEQIRQNKMITDLLEQSSYGIISKGSNHSSGKNGCAFEMAVKRAFNSTSVRISQLGNSDLRFTYNGKMISCEIKSGGGELFNIDESGNLKNRKFDYFIYVDRFESEEDLDFAIFIERNEFLALAQELKLIRMKRSSGMQKAYKKGESWYYDRLTMQSPGPNRIKQFNELMENGMLLTELLEKLGRR